MLVTTEEYSYLAQGYRERQQEEYNRARWICYNVMQVMPFIKRRPSSPEAYIPFDWDGQSSEPKHTVEVTAEEVAELSKMFQEYQRQNGDIV